MAKTCAVIYLVSWVLLGSIMQPANANIHYEGASHNPQAQALFDEAMLSYYGYQYAQAEYNFREALKLDADCGMCHWGIAISKKQQALEFSEPFAKIGVEDINEAQRKVSLSQHFMHDLVNATTHSFSLDETVTPKQLQLSLINALKALNEKYKNNSEWKEESLALLTDAMAYYSYVDDGIDPAVGHCNKLSASQYKKEVGFLLFNAIESKTYKPHPGILHTYIHMAERELTDPVGLQAAQMLPTFTNQTVAHYTHMPTHIYWRRGMYAESIQANLAAIKVDENYFNHGGVGKNTYYYEFHFLHSHHFLTLLGVLTNQFDLAIHYAQSIKKLMHPERMNNIPNDRDIYLSLEHLVLARFNKWNEVLALTTPARSGNLALLLTPRC